MNSWECVVWLSGKSGLGYEGEEPSSWTGTPGGDSEPHCHGSAPLVHQSTLLCQDIHRRRVSVYRPRCGSLGNAIREPVPGAFGQQAHKIA